MKASHSSSIRKPDRDFGNFNDKLELADITMKLKETQYNKFQYVNNIQTIFSNMNFIQISGSELAEKITQTINK